MRSGDLHRRWASVSWVLAVALLAGAVVLPDRAATAQAADDEGVSFVVSAGTSASLNGRGSFLARVGFAPGAPIAPLRLPAACNTVGAVTYRVENFLTGEPLGDGLRFDAATRTISGTPTASANRVYKLIATDSGGTAGVRADTAQFVFRLSISASHATTTNTSTDCTTTPTPTTTTVPPTTPTTTTTTTVPPPTTTTTTTTVPPPTTTTTTTTVPVAAPTATGRLTAVELTAGAAATTIDVAAAFTGTIDTYTAASSHPTTVTASMRGPILSLTPQAAGTATVTITATNTTGSATQTLTATVKPPAPTTSGTLPPQTLTTGATATVDVAAAFTGTIDTYTATSSHPTIVTATTTGSVVTLNGVAAGTATITVTATNTTGTAQQSFTVTVASAPRTAGTLAPRALTAGASVDVDVAAAFTGTVDTYTVTSNNGTVVDVALAGSTVTLTGVAAGTATVTIVAANAAGRATQTLAVTVNLPPAPTLGDPLAAQTLQATETRTIDIAAGFNGQIDSYTAASGDTNTLAATVDGSQITLTGIAEGSTTVTITAINAAGRAARSFTITISALTPPQTAATPTARTIAVGEELPINIADAFTGIVHTYTATSNNTNTLTATADGPTVTLVGVAAGTATITLQATNTTGSATQRIPVTVQIPDELAVAVAAPSHCLGSEGTLAPGGGRRGVGHIDLTYHITGGALPYTITSPDTTQTATEPTGTLTIPCSQRGIDLTTADPTANVVEAGPRTLTITATDNTATTTTTNIQIEVAENAYTTAYNNSQMHEGKTYVLGTPDDWVLLTLPQGLTLQFGGLSEGQRAHFTEPTTGAEIVLDWTTGTEIRRIVPTTGTASRARRSNSAYLRSAAQTATPTIATLLNTFTASVTSSPRGTVRNDTEGKEWRPYGHVGIGRTLTAKTTVGVHPRIREGEPLIVCTPQPNAGLRELIEKSVAAWNGRLRAANSSFTRDVFTFQQTCQGNEDVKIQMGDTAYIRSRCNTRASEAPPPACADNEIESRMAGSAPEVTGEDIYIRIDHAVHTLDSPGKGHRLRVMMHELGHMLGLGDYPFCSTKIFESLMAGGRCEPGDAGTDDWSVARDLIEDTDLDDLRAIYHPGARTDMYFRRDGVTPGDISSWALVTGNAPMIFDEDGVLLDDSLVSNAFSYVVYRHYLDWRPIPELVGGFNRITTTARPEAKLFADSRFSSPRSISQVRGRTFVVAGVTRGDIRTGAAYHVGEHSLQSLDLVGVSGGFKDWTLGGIAIVHGPPSAPLNVRAGAQDGAVFVMWDPVRGATDYDVFWNDERIGNPPAGSVNPVGYLGVRNVPAGFSGPCGVTVRISENIANGTTYFFRVRANQSPGDFYSDLSDNASATPRAFRLPRGADGNAPSDSARTAAAGGGSAQSNPCAVGLPPVLEPDVGVSGECPVDGHPWRLRVVGEGFVCDRLDSAPATPGERVVRCPRVEPPYVVVPVGGVEKCRRTLVAAPTATPGDPECEDGFTPVSGGALCSRTDSVAATPATTYGCSGGYTLVTTVVPFSTPLRRCEKSVPAKATTVDECRSGYRLVTSGSASCVSSVPATESVTYSCRAPYSLVSLGTPFCYDSVSAKATTVYECRSGYRLVMSGSASCVSSVPATESVTYSCEAGYSLVNFGTPLCYRSVSAKATTVYECRSGYRLVTRLLGGAISRYCARTVAATATYSCDRGYTRSGRTCYKYIYTSLTGSRCPAGYTLIFNGLYHQCRKKVTVDATVTYSCDSGFRLSGRTCTRTTTPTSRVTYSCDSGFRLSGRTCTRSVAPTATTSYHCNNAPPGHTLSGTNCIHRVAPTSRVVYDCDTAPPGYRLSGSNCIHRVAPVASPSYHCNNAPPGHTLSGTDCIHRVAPTSRVVYDCDDAPPGYTLSGTDCVHTTTPTAKTTYDCDTAPSGYTLSGTDCIKVTTQAPTPTTEYTCPATYTRNEPADAADPPTCTKTDTVNATVTTTPHGCDAVPADEPPYQLHQDHVAGTIKHTCERTITITASITRTYTCPSRYRLEKTISGQEIEHICRLRAG